MMLGLKGKGLIVLTIFIVNIVLGLSMYMDLGRGLAIEPEREALIESIEALREVIGRILPYADIGVELRSEIEQYIAGLSDEKLLELSITELEEVRLRLEAYLDTLSASLVIQPEIAIEIEEGEAKAIIEALREISVTLNVSNIGDIISLVDRLVEEGRYGEALKVLEGVEVALNEHSASIVSRDLFEDVIELLEELSEVRDGLNATEALELSIENIGDAIEVLMDVKSYLESVNASMDAILAIDLAIASLNNTINILSSTLEGVGNLSIPGLFSDVFDDSIIQEVFEEIAEARGDIAEYRYKIEVLLNISIGLNDSISIDILNDASALLDEAEILVNMSEANALDGNYTEALASISEAEAYIEAAEELVEAVEERIEEVEEVEVEAEERLAGLMEWIDELREDIVEYNATINYLLNISVSLNITIAIEYLNLAQEYLLNASIRINLAIDAINGEDYSLAVEYLREAEQLIERAEKNIDIAEDIVEEAGEEEEEEEAEDELLEELLELQGEIDELWAEYEYLWNLTIEYNVTEAGEILTEAREKLENASSLLDEALDAYSDGDIARVGMLIGEIKALLENVDNLLDDAESIIEEAISSEESIEEEETGEEEEEAEESEEAGEEESEESGEESEEHPGNESGGDIGSGGSGEDREEGDSEESEEDGESGEDEEESEDSEEDEE